MSKKPFDFNKHVAETVLTYDDPSPEYRKELERYLATYKKKPIETQRAPVKKKTKNKEQYKIEIDIKVPDYISRRPLEICKETPKYKEKHTTAKTKLISRKEKEKNETERGMAEVQSKSWGSRWSQKRYSKKAAL